MKNRFFRFKKDKKNKNKNRTMGKVDSFFEKVDNLIREKIGSNIQLELIFAVAFCLVFAFFIYHISINLTRKEYQHSYISFEVGINNIKDTADTISERMLNDLRYKKEEDITEEMRENTIYDSENDPNAKQFDLEKAMDNLIHDFSDLQSLEAIVTDLDGDIIYKTDNVYETSVDIFELIKNSYDVRYYQDYYEDINNNFNSYQNGYSYFDNSSIDYSEIKELTFVYPMNFLDENIFLVIRDSPMPETRTDFTESYNQSISLLFALLAFILGFMYLTKNKMLYIQELSNAVNVMSTGNLKYTAPIKGNDELTNLASSLNSMANEINIKIEEERKLEQMKNELITNVSHDLRTPLTSIIGYLGLAKQKNASDEEIDSYINIAYNKSETLKILINELFEYSKLQRPEKEMDFKYINIKDLLDQLIEEMVPMAKEHGLAIKKHFPNDDTFIFADGNKIVRVFENLISNAIKYSFKETPIIISIHNYKDKVKITVENSVDSIEESEIEKMFERFYRFEKSRSSQTGGSGLGLAISKNIVSAHGGKIYAESLEKDSITIVVELNKNI